jgi:hypothetical protein
MSLASKRSLPLKEDPEGLPDWNWRPVDLTLLELPLTPVLRRVSSEDSNSEPLLIFPSCANNGSFSCERNLADAASLNPRRNRHWSFSCADWMFRPERASAVPRCVQVYFGELPALTSLITSRGVRIMSLYAAIAQLLLLVHPDTTYSESSSATRRIPFACLYRSPACCTKKSRREMGSTSSSRSAEEVHARTAPGWLS